MAVKIRLARAGAKKKPFYRVVVTDSRSPRDGRFIEIVGRYNPRTTPTLVELELDRIEDWISKGATPSETVTKLIAIAGDPEASAPQTAKDRRPSKRTAEQAAAQEEKAKEPAPAEAAPAEDEPVEEAAAEAAAGETPEEPADAAVDGAEAAADQSDA